MRQIIAMGGGGFSMEPENLLLDVYVLRQTTVERPKVCFIPTASGDSEDYIRRFYTSFQTLHCQPSHLSLFRPPTRDLAAFLLEKDVIYVGGGNTKNLLALWRDWGLDSILKSAWNEGIVLAGVSAGSICWFEEGITDSYGENLAELRCLGFLPGSNCPHYDGEAARRPTYHELLEDGKIGPGFAADDGVALHYVDTELHAIVSSRPTARAFQLHVGEQGVHEDARTPVFLGAAPGGSRG